MIRFLRGCHFTYWRFLCPLCLDRDTKFLAFIPIIATIWATLFAVTFNESHDTAYLITIVTVIVCAVAFCTYKWGPKPRLLRPQAIADLLTLLYEFGPSWNHNWRDSITGLSWDATKKDALTEYARKLNSSLAKAQSEGILPSMPDSSIQGILGKLNHLCDIIPPTLYPNPYARPGHDFDQFTTLGDQIATTIHQNIIPQLESVYPE